MREFTRTKCQGPRDHTGDHTLREPAQSKCTWTFPKTNFTLYTEIYRKNAAAQNRDTDFVRACAVEMHVDISQESLYTGIYRKNAAAQMERPDQAPAIVLTIRTTQGGHTSRACSGAFMCCAGVALSQWQHTAWGKKN